MKIEFSSQILLKSSNQISLKFVQWMQSYCTRTKRQTDGRNDSRDEVISGFSQFLEFA